MLFGSPYGKCRFKEAPCKSQQKRNIICEKITFLFCVIAVVLVSSASTVAFDLKCDAGDGALQAGWTRMTMGTTVVGGINVTLSHGPLPGGASDSRITGLGSGALADVEDDFYFPDNTSGSPDADMTLTLSGMDAGDYALHSYHNDARGCDDHRITSVTVTGATDVTTPVDTFQNHDIMSDPLEILFTYGGSGSVVITYHAMPGGLVFFNGFELRPAGPSVPSVHFDSAISGAVEAVSPAIINVVLSEALGETVTVDYSVTGGTATVGADYELEGYCGCDLNDDGLVDYLDIRLLGENWLSEDPGNPANMNSDSVVNFGDYSICSSEWFDSCNNTLVFDPEQTSRIINFNIINDGIDEEDETVILELSNPTGPDVMLGEITRHTYTIHDPRPEVTFDTDNTGNTEDTGLANILVILSGSLTETATVDYEVTGGTADGGGADYTLTDGTLTFNPGQTSRAISISIVDDGVDEDNETIVITLSNPANAKLGAITEFTYTIIDPSSLNLKIDIALPVWTGIENVPDWEGVPIPETLKDGWIPWCAGRWEDMYGHGTVAMENVADTGLSTMISTVYGGLTAVKVCGMCMPRLNGGTPYGSPIHDPICNSWLQVEDHPENPSGDIVMALWNLPTGEYELYSYHNNCECHRGGSTPEGTEACCDLITNPQPLMPSIMALSANGLEARYAHLEWWARWMDVKREFLELRRPECFWDHPLGEIYGNNVTTTLAAYNVPVQQVTQDSQLVPSLIRFHTDGSAVFIVYESGCCVPDGIRPSREGGRAILNAFELRRVGN